MSFDDDAALAGQAMGRRRAFWEASKQLQWGALVCLWQEVRSSS